MKTTKVIRITALIMSLFLSSCYYDEVAVIEGVPTGVSLKNDVQPIFDNYCNNTNCHDAEGSHAPVLVYPDTYNALKFGGFVKPFEPQNSILFILVKTGEMPPSGPLDINSQKLIEGWITDGALNN